MKVETAKMDTEVHGEIATSNFTIKADAFMFDTLFAGLYKDPMTAAIREIVSNAYDSNQNQPFHVRLPNAIDKIFSVRDFGEGMSHDFVMKLYTMAGHSDKRKTNQAVGGYGIGSKSPLAYTNSFNIISVHQGMKSVYNVYRQDDGLPVISWFASEETSDPSGVEVSFAVETKDIETFNEKAKSVFVGFIGLNSYPIVEGSEYKLPTLEASFKISDSIVGNIVEPFDQAINQRPYRRNSLYVRMGCVLYDVSHVNNDPYRKGQNEFFDKKTLILDVDIGKFKITRSRDSLILTREEESTLNSAFRALKEKYISHCLKDYIDLEHAEDILEKGIELNQKDFVSKHFITIISLIVDSNKNPFHYTQLKFSFTEPYVSTVKTKELNNSQTINIFRNLSFNLSKPFARILICNSTNKIPSRAKYFHNKVNSGCTVFFESESDIPKRILNLFKEYFEVYYTEDFEPPKTSVTRTTKYKKGLAKEVRKDWQERKSPGSTFESLTKKLDIENIKEGKFIVIPTKKNHVKLNVLGVAPEMTLKEFENQFKEFLNEVLHRSGYRVLIVSESNIPNFDKNVELYNFSDFIKDEIASNLDVYKDCNLTISGQKDYYIYSNFMSDFFVNSFKDVQSLKTPDNEEIINLIERIVKVKNAYKIPRSILNKLCFASTLPDEWQKLNRKYPLFRFLNRMSKKEIQYYLKTVGEMK